MATLTVTNFAFHSSWHATAAELGDSHRDGGGDVDRSLGELRDPETFRHYMGGLGADALPETPASRITCPAPYMWVVEDEEVIVFLAIRDQLNEFLFNEGGNIGYSIRPSSRRRGHGAKALGDALPMAKRLGLDSVLLTSEEDNAGSRRTIELKGGSYGESRNGKCRYWIDAAGPRFRVRPVA